MNKDEKLAYISLISTIIQTQREINTFFIYITKSTSDIFIHMSYLSPLFDETGIQFQIFLPCHCRQKSAISVAHFFTKLTSLNGFFDLASSKATV
jgi:hypothetical protein